MLIIREFGDSLRDLLPLVREQEGKGYRYMRDEPDGAELPGLGIFDTPDDHRIVYIDDSPTTKVPCRRLYFDDGSEELTYLDRVEEHRERLRSKYLEAYRCGVLVITEERSPFQRTQWSTKRLE